MADECAQPTLALRELSVQGATNYERVDAGWKVYRKNVTVWEACLVTRAGISAWRVSKPPSQNTQVL